MTAKHTPGPRENRTVWFDSYSYHEVTGNTRAERGWAVVGETLDEQGDILDTEEVAFFRSEQYAKEKVEQFNARAAIARAKGEA